MFKKFLAMFAVALAVLAGSAVPAQAAYTDCSAYPNTVCFHENVDYTGTVWRLTAGQVADCRNARATFNDKASTAFNSTTEFMLVLHQAPDCTGPYFFVPPGQSYAFAWATSVYWWNDRMSSIQLLRIDQ